MALFSDPTKLRRKRKSEAPEENVKRSRTEDNEEDKENGEPP